MPSSKMIKATFAEALNYALNGGEFVTYREGMGLEDSVIYSVGGILYKKV